MEKSETEKKLSAYRAGHYALKAGSYAAAVTPCLIQLGVNWNDWFSPENDAPSLGMGFAMLLVSTIASVTAVMKKDSEMAKKFSPLVAVALLFGMWGISFLLLSQIARELGWMLIYSALGILAGAVGDEVDKAVVAPRYELFKKVADENGLTSKGEFEKKAIEQARKDKLEKYNGTRI